MPWFCIVLVGLEKSSVWVEDSSVTKGLDAVNGSEAKLFSQSTNYLGGSQRQGQGVE